MAVAFLDDILFSALDVSVAWYVPIAHFLLCLGLKWLYTVEFALMSLSGFEWKEETSAHQRFFALRTNIYGDGWLGTYLDIAFALSSFVILSIAWSHPFQWLGIALIGYSAVGYLARLAAYRRALKSDELPLKQLAGWDLLQQTQPLYDRAWFLAALSALTYPYSAYPLLLLLVIEPKLPRITNWLLVRCGVCTPASFEMKRMVNSAADALSITPPTYLVAEISIVTAFAASGNRLVVLSRPALEALKQPELVQAILDHEVAHIAQFDETRLPWRVVHILWLSLLLSAITFAKNTSVAGGWPLDLFWSLITPLLLCLICGAIIVSHVVMLGSKEKGSFPLFNSKDRLRNAHKRSEVNEDEADRFARERVGTEVYREALLRMLGSPKEEVLERHDFGYPSLLKRFGQKDTDEQAVLREIEDMGEVEIPLTRLLKFLTAYACLSFIFLVCYFGPMMITPLGSFLGILPQAKRNLVLVAIATGKLHTSPDREWLKNEDAPDELDTLLARLLAARFERDPKALEEARADILRASEKHYIYSKSLQLMLERLREEAARTPE